MNKWYYCNSQTSTSISYGLQIPCLMLIQKLCIKSSFVSKGIFHFPNIGLTIYLILVLTKNFLNALISSVMVGLILVPNGKLLGKQFGDKYPYEEALAKAKLEKQNQEQLEISEEPDGPGGRLYGSDYEYHKELISNITIKDGDPKPQFVHEEHPWGIFFTVLGTVLLDFDADACQSPSRAYLLDVTTAGKYE